MSLTLVFHIAPLASSKTRKESLSGRVSFGVGSDPWVWSNHILLERVSTSAGVSSVLRVGRVVERCVLESESHTSSDADEDHESSRYTGDHFAVDCGNVRWMPCKSAWIAHQ